ncbi:MAG: MarR family transcriptional regulator [Aquihabitans sp.]
MATTSTPQPAPTNETKWLDDAEQQAWRSFVNGARRLLGQLDAELKVSGISHDDYGVLVLLSEAPDDRLRMSDLADGVVESRSRLSHHISRLEKRGLVVREACPEDGRGSWAVLTTEGRALMERVAPHHVAGVRRWFLDQISAEQLSTIGDAFSTIDRGLLGGGTADPATSGSDTN